MVDLLEVPAIFAGLRFDGDHRIREYVVAGADPSIEVGPRVACSEVEESQLRIHGWSLPNRCAAVLPRVAIFGPGVMPDFTRSRDRVESPDQVPVCGAVRFDAPAGAILATCEGGNHHSVVIQRSRSDGVP